MPHDESYGISRVMSLSVCEGSFPEWRKGWRRCRGQESNAQGLPLILHLRLLSALLWLSSKHRIAVSPRVSASVSNCARERTGYLALRCSHRVEPFF